MQKVTLEAPEWTLDDVELARVPCVGELLHVPYVFARLHDNRTCFRVRTVEWSLVKALHSAQCTVQLEHCS